jgi:hypothetical protein
VIIHPLYYLAVEVNGHVVLQALLPHQAVGPAGEGHRDEEDPSEEEQRADPLFGCGRRQHGPFYAFQKLCVSVKVVQTSLLRV